ncbi:Lrp/AsnC family transcriptional regulator [Rhizobium puerariae]|uniref:Lrp/AsnC family transcriptional regulator n=1 Tax=Rhizobium puerariae TaxID=1585791 RepID=A0ABV6AMT7_9HYPH
MDLIDRKILSELQENADLSAAELSTKVGLSHTPCWRRLKKIEESGVIKERTVVLDPAAVGLSISVYAEINIVQHDENALEAFEQSVKDRPEIVECFSMSGQRDYLLRIVVKDVQHYELFLKKVLLHLPGVKSVNSSFALKTIKLTTKLPLFVDKLISQY